MSDPYRADMEDLWALRRILSDLSIHLMFNEPGAIDRGDMYSRLYWARHRLGRVVARYGEGQPPQPEVLGRKQ